MAIHRLYIDDFETINYSLIAIHSNLDDYRLAYFINKSLNLELKKNEKDIPIETKFGNSSAKVPHKAGKWKIAARRWSMASSTSVSRWTG